MDPRELDLNEIDALLGEDDLVHNDIEEDSDDFDDLLAGDDFDLEGDFGLDDEDEEDSLEEILGAIDNQYLSEKEQVFLQNKAFLSSKNPTELDSFFMEYQETLYGALDEYHNDDEVFGADGAESLEDIELEVDLMNGSCFGSDEEEDVFLEEAILNGECMGFDEEEFGVLPYGVAAASGLFGKKVQRGIQQVGRNIGRGFQQAGRNVSRFAKKHKKGIAAGLVALPAAAIAAPVALPAAAIAAPAALAVSARNNAKTKRNYIRKINALKRCVKKFERIARKVDSGVAVKLVAGRRSFLRRPFSVMAASSTPDKKIVSAVLAGKPLALKNRRLANIAKKCDKKYAQLRRIYKGLRAKGRAVGVQAPASIFNGIMKNLSLKAKKASKANGGAIAAVTAASIVASKPSSSVVIAPKSLKQKRKFKLAARKKAKEMMAIRRANRIAAMKERKEMREKVIAAARQNRKNRIMMRKKLAEEKKADAAMVASNPYMDAADMAALNRARAERMPKPIKPMRPVIKPVRRLRKPAPANLKKQAIVSAEENLKKLDASLKRHAALHRKSLATQNKFKKGSSPWNAQYSKTRAYAKIITNLNSKIKQQKASLAKLMG